MIYRYNLVRVIVLCCASALGVSQAAADCGIILPDPSCPMGTFGYMAQQMQDQNAAAAAAADPRNLNDPASPYYRTKQCEAAKYSIYCQLGISCEGAPYLNCENADPRTALRHR